MMRATGQVPNLTGPLGPEESKVVVARSILGEWLGGSGGGWQDSGGIFPGDQADRRGLGRARRPGMGRQPRAAAAVAPDLEPGGTPAASPRRGQARDRVDLPEALAASLVVSMAGWRRTSVRSCNMVTTKYLLRDPQAWARPA